jgi:hypothetical protein
MVVDDHQENEPWGDDILFLEKGFLGQVQSSKGHRTKEVTSLKVY